MGAEAASEPTRAGSGRPVACQRRSGHRASRETSWCAPMLTFPGPARSPSPDECVHAMSTVLVYSDDERIRERVRLAIGRRPDPELEPIDFLDAAEGAAVTLTVSQGGVDLCILD